MPISSSGQEALPSTRPYLVRALHEWCVDNGFAPHIAVQVDGLVQVPLEYVKGGEIVLNVSMDATSGLRMGNEFIEFKARFGGTARDIVVPMTHVIAVYARENGQGMSFPPPKPVLRDASLPPPVFDPRAPGLEANTAPSRLHAVPTDPTDQPPPEPPPSGAPGSGKRPQLKRVK